MSDEMSVKDALIYSKFSNILNSSVLQQINTSIYTTDTGKNQIEADKELDQTTIKRACCMERENPENNKEWLINVRIPIPKDKTPDPASYLTKVGVFTKKVAVPKSMCPSDYKKESTKCDSFMKLYCENSKELFKQHTNWDGNGSNFDIVDWNVYRPECACYGEYADPDLQQFAPKCSITGCKEGLPDVYLDPTSRKENCELTICKAYSTSGNQTAQRNSTINQITNLACGGKASSQDIANQAVAGALGSTTTRPTTTPTTRPTTTTTNSDTSETSDSTSDESSSSDSSFKLFGITIKTKYAIIICIVIGILLICSSSIAYLSGGSAPNNNPYMTSNMIPNMNPYMMPNMMQ